ncbi:MAG: tocopherol cyclase family protein [Bacteroidales bacterium]
MMLRKKIRSLFNPEIFQGWGKKRNYFEGWYFKFLNREGNRAFAVIPGVAMDAAGNRHSFIQLLDGRKRTASYHKFDFDSFVASGDRFLVSVEDNHFSTDSISLNLPEIKGKICFSGNVPWPKPWYSPGIMGPYSFVPFMECYHGIVSMDHLLNGKLKYNGKLIDFSGGRGYIEKDWGSSFPEGYIWLQSNHFDESGISIKTSVAKIPWLGSSFTGFISGLWLGDRLIRFTTYNGSVLRKVSVDRSNVEIVIENKIHRLEIYGNRDSATSLASPIGGFMDGRIEESMTSEVEVNLTFVKDRISLFTGTGRNTALEVAGRVEEILV